MEARQSNPLKLINGIKRFGVEERMKQYIAIYLRISKEDKDCTGLKDESNSIHSQRILVKEYIKTHASFVNKPVLEFMNDGLTGTNFVEVR